MRQAPPRRVQQAIKIDDLMPWIRQERELREALVLLRNPINHFLKVWFGIDRDRQDLYVPLLLGIQEVLQLSKLSGAIWSPMSSIEDKNNILPPPIIRQSDRRSIFGFKHEIRGSASGFDSFQVGWRESRSIFRTGANCPLIQRSESAAQKQSHGEQQVWLHSSSIRVFRLQSTP